MSHLLLLLLSGPALALTVEVQPGDDIATLTSALAAGDEVIFADGVYPLTSALSWTGAGTEQAPIVLRAADGASPVLELRRGKGGSFEAWQIANLSQASFFQVRGLAFRGGEGWDLEDAAFNGLVLSETSDVELIDVEISRTGSHALVLSGNHARATVTRPHLHDTRDGDGISAGCWDASCFVTDSVIDNAWIHGIRGQRHGVYLAHGSQGNTLRDTVLYDVEYRGLFLGSTEFGPPNTVEGNAIWQVGDWAMTVYGAARVRNNLVWLAGAGIYSGDPDRGAYEDVVISYNTVVDTEDEAVELDDWTAAPGMVLSSNALCNPVGLGVDVERQADKAGEDVPFADATISGNVVCGYVTGLSEDLGHLVPGGGWGDFLDVQGWALYPARDSVLRDAGDPSSGAWVPEADFNGTPRPGDAPDAGAYEWTQDENPGWVVQESFKDLEADNTQTAQVLGGCCSKKEGGADTGALVLLPLAGLWGLRRARRVPEANRR